MIRVIKFLMHPKKALLKLKFRYVTRKNRIANSKTNILWSNQDYILANVQAAQSLALHEFSDIPEAEHQIRRFGNIKKVIDEVNKLQIRGDIIEFGTWQGMSLLLFNLALGEDSSDRRLIGIDSFEGLPEDSNTWKRGAFSNTSLETARRNISMRIKYNQEFDLIKGWFDDPRVTQEIESIVSQISIVHFDADLGSSTKSALDIIGKFLPRRTQPIYFLFDDWGCHPDEVPDAFYTWLQSIPIYLGIKVEKISATRFTRYYRITVGN